MSASATAATPQRPSSDQVSSQITPFSRGSGSNVASDVNVTQAHYKPFLREDLKFRRVLNFEEFLLYMFGKQVAGHTPTNFQEMLNDQAFNKALDAYENLRGRESLQYTPFAKIVTDALGKLRQPTSLEMKLPVNDTKVVRGSKAARNPDGAIVLKDDASENVSNIAWLKVVAFIEHKILKEHSADSPTGEPIVGKGIDHYTRTSVSTLLYLGQVGRRRSGSKIRGGKGPTKAKSNSEGKTSKGPAPIAQPLRRSPRFSPQPLNSDDLMELLERNMEVGTQGPSNIEMPLVLLEHPAGRKTSLESPSAPKPLTREEAMLQCASYALELMSNGEVRSHAFGLLISNTLLEPLCYDRSIIVSCEPFDISKDRKKFVRFLSCLAQLSREGWGMVSWFEPPSNHLPSIPPQAICKVSKCQFLNMRLENGDKLTNRDTIYRQDGLIGRGTPVFRADWCKNGKKLPPTLVVVKISWCPETRIPEAKFVNDAKECMKTPADRHILNHLQNILYSEERKAGHLQERLKKHSNFKDDYEMRMARITIHEELSPITELTTAEDLLEAMRGIFNCYRWLYETAKIMHRDISLNNLMFRRKDGKIYGVLNDMDLAVSLDTTEASSKQRTGTKPFLAIDLLGDNPPRHKYRHDLESFFYVFVWITSRYHNGVQANGRFQKWAIEDFENCRAAKIEFFIFPRNTKDWQTTPDFTKLRPLLKRIYLAFKKGIIALQSYIDACDLAEEDDIEPPEPFDEDTWGGHVTFESFEKILDIKI